MRICASSHIHSATHMPAPHAGNSRITDAAKMRCHLLFQSAAWMGAAICVCIDLFLRFLFLFQQKNVYVLFLHTVWSIENFHEMSFWGCVRAMRCSSVVAAAKPQTKTAQNDKRNWRGVNNVCTCKYRDICGGTSTWMHTYAKLWLHMRRAQMQLADKCAAPIAISGSAHEAKERMRSVMKNEKFLFKSGKQTSRRDDLAAARAYQYERGTTNVNFYVFFVVDLSQNKKQKLKHFLYKI